MLSSILETMTEEAPKPESLLDGVLRMSQGGLAFSQAGDGFGHLEWESVVWRQWLWGHRC